MLLFYYNNNINITVYIAIKFNIIILNYWLKIKNSIWNEEFFLKIELKWQSKKFHDLLGK